MQKPVGLALVLSGLFATAGAARADEGMWLFNAFPRDAVKAKYGFAPDDKWLEHVRLASARLAGGCSASFVSPAGLVLTNHHCAHSCIQQLSTPGHDYVKSGFYARSEADEVKCPEIELNQLTDITDVTEQITKATQGLEGEKFMQARKTAESQIEKACATSDKVRCDVVTLYHGGQYHLYQYRRFQDVRLVFAPELSTAFFGGDPDNFMFPRWDLDLSMLRVYEDGKPAKVDHYLKWSRAGVKAGDLTFVSGHPGGTDRQLTMAQLEYQRDYALPERLLYLAESRGVFTEFQKRSEEAKRTSTADLFYIENSFKALRGRFEALVGGRLMDDKRAEEKAFRAKLASKPEWAKKYLPAYDAIAKATVELRQIRKPLSLVEFGRGFQGDLFRLARGLVRGGEERGKPNEKRLDEYRDAALPQLTQRLFSKKPIYDDVEIAWLTFGLIKLREDLGPDDPLVKKTLGSASPDELATRLIKSTKLKDVALRHQLWDGGKKAIDAAEDPLIQFVKAIDPAARTLRKKFDDEIESVLLKNGELLARARFEIEGAKSYPDATFTLRLNYGQVKGWTENGKPVPPLTDMGGAFTRATGRPPFDLPQSWLSSKGKLELKTPLDFCSTNDIIGGNSGSPVVNKEGELVGLIFDGNIHSLGGDYGFDETDNRAIAVHSEGILHALARIYGADRLVRELRPATSSAGGSAPHAR